MKTYWLNIIWISFLFVVSANSQNRVINGKVYTLDSLAVANFEVKAKKSGAGVITDSLGRFSIVTKPKDVLLFKGKVFRNERVRINDNIKDSIYVEVTFIPTSENKKMAVGYGYVTKDRLINAVSQLDGDEVDFCNYSNIFDLIRGRFAGVQIMGPEILIRGPSSNKLSSSSLLVVDGNVVRSIAHISPCDVADINVIKDSGASIYGSRGANGVVVIETRKGDD
jgi:TonB-dependent SusC/RagA subfamily outer membrane receptor